MWLQRILKISASGPAGGGGGDLGVAGDNVMGIGGGQGSLFQEAPNREELSNNMKRRQKRKMLERKRKWRSSRDQRQHL